MEKCKEPFCKYINKTRKYCALNRKLFTFNKDKCQLYPKKKKTNKLKYNYDRQKNYTRFSRTDEGRVYQPSPSTKKETLSAMRKKRARITIKKFMAKSALREKITARFLNSICSDSGVCIVFGLETTKIKKFFNNFVDFKYLTDDIKRIGDISVNGFLYELKYLRQKYNAYAILKSSVRKSNDNLMYEYFVGQTVNDFNIRFPCFVETYGLFKYKTEDDWKALINNSPNKVDIIKNNLIIVNNPSITDLKTGCTDSKLYCLLIQHIKDAKSLEMWVKESLDFVEYELYPVLYIIYFTLAALFDNFTHYDLHAQNVLLYIPVQDKYIDYVLHENILVDSAPRVIKFKSRFIPKMIDYGRCFYESESKNNSNTIYNELCKIKECEPDCGYDVGFNWLNNKDYHITSRKRNASHDLRLLQYLNLIHINKSPNVSANIKNFFNMVDDYGKNDYISRDYYGNIFGTKENMSSGIPNNKINNVLDAAKVLGSIVLNNFDNYNKYFKKYTSLGELHVYMDGSPMKFIKA
jgi:hypothetical protein